MIETCVKSRTEVDSTGVDDRMQYVALAFHKGNLIAWEWFGDYMSASLWSLDYAANKEVK